MNTQRDRIVPWRPPDTCPIWPGFKIASSDPDPNPKSLNSYILGSARAGGNYVITDEAVLILKGEDSPYDDRVRAKLTTMLIEMRRQGEDWPMVSTRLVEEAANAPDIPIHERANRLLVFLGEKTEKLGQVVQPLHSHLRPLEELQLEALARSESVDETEVSYLEDYLHKRGFISGDPGQPVITVEGYARIAELTASNTDSAQAFVAMWFDDSMNEVYSDAILPAIEAAGYRPFRVDQSNSLDRIEDQVIAEIRRSKFIVADVSHGQGGARGSVYWEAGFAYGLNIPIVYTARRGTEPHFDVSHFPHIFWKHETDLRSRLEQRIRAAAGIGPGPTATDNPA